MVCQYCIKYNCRTVSVFAHSLAVYGSIFLTFLFSFSFCVRANYYYMWNHYYYIYNLQYISMCEYNFFVSVSFCKRFFLPISSLWSHYDVMKLCKLCLFFIFPLLAQRLFHSFFFFALIHSKSKTESFSCAFSPICFCMCMSVPVIQIGFSAQINENCHHSAIDLIMSSKLKTRK